MCLVIRFFFPSRRSMQPAQINAAAGLKCAQRLPLRTHVVTHGVNITHPKAKHARKASAPRIRRSLTAAAARWALRGP